MKPILLLLFLGLALNLFAQPDTDKQAILKVMDDQQNAWNQADIQRFMEGYWKSGDLKFVGKNGISYGWDTTLKNYKKSYPDAKAMGKLTFTILHLEKLSGDEAFMIGKFHLKREKDELNGHFTLLWKKMNGQWLIVVDHTS